MSVQYKHSKFIMRALRTKKGEVSPDCLCFVWFYWKHMCRETWHSNNDNNHRMILPRMKAEGTSKAFFPSCSLFFLKVRDLGLPSPSCKWSWASMWQSSQWGFNLLDDPMVSARIKTSRVSLHGTEGGELDTWLVLRFYNAVLVLCFSISEIRMQFMTLYTLNSCKHLPIKNMLDWYNCHEMYIILRKCKILTCNDYYSKWSCTKQENEQQIFPWKRFIKEIICFLLIQKSSYSISACCKSQAEKQMYMFWAKDSREFPSVRPWRAARLAYLCTAKLISLFLQALNSSEIVQFKPKITESLRG